MTIYGDLGIVINIIYGAICVFVILMSLFSNPNWKLGLMLPVSCFLYLVFFAIEPTTVSHAFFKPGIKDTQNLWDVFRAAMVDINMGLLLAEALLRRNHVK